MLPMVWRRLLRSVRVALGVCCIALRLSAPEHTSVWITGLYAAYLLYAVVALVWHNLEDAGHSGFVPAIDSAFLFLAISSSLPHFAAVSVVFYAFVLTTAIIQHDWWIPVVIASLCIVDLNVSQPADYPILFPAFAGAGILCSAIALERYFLKERLANASRQNVLYRYDAEKAREAERQRIAADFHDGPLQSFIGFQMRLEVIRKLMDARKDEAEKEIIALQDLCKSQLQELRAFVRSMRPVDMEASLRSSLRRAIDQFQKDSGIPTSFVSSDFADPPDTETSLETLQIVREALYNIQKHAGATRVTVVVNKIEGALEISIEDNGRGFPFSGKYTLQELELLRLGPASIKSRVRTLGGDLLLDSKPGQGAGLRVWLAA